MDIVVLMKLNDEQKRFLESEAPGCNFIYTKNEQLSEEQLKNAGVIIGNPPSEMLKLSKKLQLLQLFSAGVGDYAKEGVLPDRARLANASGAYGLAISEYMLGVLLELYKNLHIYRDNQAEGNWSYAGNVKGIFGSTALIVGLGDIGGEFASRLKALGAYTIGIRRTDSKKPDYLDELHLMDKLEDLLPRADIVALSLPETKLTNRVINKSTLQLFKKDAVLINVGRGSAIDTEALCDALENRQLLGAALDVTDPEPLPREHRLWKMKNAVITPHISGGFSLNETKERIVRIAAHNLKSLIEGKALMNVVDKEKGY
ncbi:D-2-hydroxyacid dehydrogenase [Ruminiclostridium cellobioparum]|uniref:Phosphoglycerate dehydrogenase n=1 Tax=Ruminiclostridium cellobioparum subsp. termitidis CT1112 TaxID=1195236 RepID=S0FN32_RUMCE|nr:D-2-hydroxyacid dehydrogenase [Ruminiclostridium cellobioparum]EMS69883.1 phosphoglycerate dehydrogenase [Ruminiclostridium cellobioparum subsp. termitidis CT1112]